MDITSEELQIPEAHVVAVFNFIQAQYPHLIQKDLFGKLEAIDIEGDAFAKYIHDTGKELVDTGYRSDNIEALLECRTLIQGNMAYLGELAAKYSNAKNTEEDRAKRELAIISMGAESVSAGDRLAKLHAEKVMALTYHYDFIYKRIKAYQKVLENRDDELKQRISYLKQQKGFNQFIDGDSHV
jgi:hypothetical protein